MQMTPDYTHPPSLEKLEAQIQEHQDFQRQSEQEIGRLEAEIALLQRARDEVFNELALDNNNKDARETLDEKDSQIALLKDELANMKRLYKRQYRTQRAKILQALDAFHETVQEEIRSKQERLNILRNVEIPEAEENLAALNIENQELQEEMLHLQKASEKASRLDIDEEL
ncbi:MAG: hypothetical protein ACOCVL_02775 [Candidatus Sumerlaeota bacterium]